MHTHTQTADAFKLGAVAINSFESSSISMGKLQNKQSQADRHSHMYTRACAHTHTPKGISQTTSIIMLYTAHSALNFPTDTIRQSDTAKMQPAKEEGGCAPKGAD